MYSACIHIIKSQGNIQHCLFTWKLGVVIVTIRDKETNIFTCSLSFIWEMLTAAYKEGQGDGLRNDLTSSRAHTFRNFTAEIQLSYYMCSWCAIMHSSLVSPNGIWITCQCLKSFHVLSQPIFCFSRVISHHVVRQTSDGVSWYAQTP